MTNANFQSFGIVSEAITGTAPTLFTASTSDDLAAITTAGYLDAFLSEGQFKENDLFYINYLDASTFPLYPAGVSSTLGLFYVSITASVSTLVAFTSGSGTASGKAVTDNAKAYVASVDGAPASYTVGNVLVAGDTNGSVGLDSGYNIANNGLLYASVAITAAQFNGMYAAPKLLIAAPGANKLIVVDQMVLLMTFVSAAYSGGGVVAAQWDSTANGAGVLATNAQKAADFTGAAASDAFLFNGTSGDDSDALFSLSVNKGLYLSNKTGAFTTGDGTWVAKVYYRIVATA